MQLTLLSASNPKPNNICRLPESNVVCSFRYKTSFGRFLDCLFLGVVLQSIRLDCNTPSPRLLIMPMYVPALCSAYPHRPYGMHVPCIFNFCRETSWDNFSYTILSTSIVLNYIAEHNAPHAECKRNFSSRDDVRCVRLIITLHR